jgi:hypothetical protein
MREKEKMREGMRTKIKKEMKDKKRYKIENRGRRNIGA